MEEREEPRPDMLDRLLVDDFYFQPDRQEIGDKKKKSSILKQTKTSNGDICEFDDIENKRKSQGIRRVSFADTFQVKELHTGNIYDIPGRHELEASKESNQESSFIEAEKENPEVLSRSSILGISNVKIPAELQSRDNVYFKHPSGVPKISDAMPEFNFEDKNLCLKRSIMADNIFEKPFTFTPQLETSTIEQSFQLSEIATTKLENSSVKKDFELTIMHKQDHLSISPCGAESSSRKHSRGENYTIKTRRIISSTISYGETETSLKKSDEEIYEFLEEQPFKGSVEHELSIGSGLLPSSIGTDDSFNKEILEHRALLFPTSNKSLFKDKLFSDDPQFDEVNSKGENYFSLNKENIPDFVFQPKHFGKEVESASYQQKDRKSAQRPWWDTDSTRLSDRKNMEGNFVMPISAEGKHVKMGDVHEASEHLLSDPFEANTENQCFGNQHFVGEKNNLYEKTADIYSTEPALTAKTQNNTNVNTTILAPSPMDMTLPVSTSGVNEESDTENNVAMFCQPEPCDLESSNDRVYSPKLKQNIPSSDICPPTSFFESDLGQPSNKTKLINDDMEITYVNPAVHSSDAKKCSDETGDKTKITANDMDVTCVSNDFLEESSIDSTFKDGTNNCGDLVTGRKVEYFSSKNERTVQNELSSKCALNLNWVGAVLPFENIELKTTSICSELNSKDEISVPDRNLSAHSSLVPERTSKEYSRDICQDYLISNKKLKTLSADTENDSNHSGETLLKDVFEHVNAGQNISVLENAILQNKQDENLHYSQMGAHGTKFMKVSEKECDKIQILHPENVLYSETSSEDFILDKENMNWNRKRNIRANSSDLKRNPLKIQEVELASKVFKFCYSNEPEIVKSPSDHQDMKKPSLIGEIPGSVQVGRSMFQSSVMDITCNTEYSNESSVCLNDLDCNSSSNKEFDNVTENSKFLFDQVFPITKESNLSLEANLLPTIATSTSSEINSKSGQNCISSIMNAKTLHFDSDGMELTCAVKSNTLHSMNNDNEETDQQEKFFQKPNISGRLSSVENPKTRHFESDVMELTCAVKSNTLHSLNNDNVGINGQEKSFRNHSIRGRVSSVEKPKTCHFESEGMEFTCAIKNIMLQSVDDDNDEENQLENSVRNWKKGKLDSVESSKTHHFESDGMELTCAIKNNALQLIDDGSFPVNQEVEYLASQDINKNRKLSENSIETCPFTSDKIEITCGVQCNENAQCSSSDNLELSVDLQDKSLFIADGMNDTSESANHTFNSHEMELTLAADRSHNLLFSPFFKLQDIFSSNSRISRREYSLGLQNKNVERHKAVPVPILDLVLQSENVEHNKMGNVVNLHKSFCPVSNDPGQQVLRDRSYSSTSENITCNKQTIQTPHETHSIHKSSQSFDCVNNRPLKPCSLKDAESKMTASEFRSLRAKPLTPAAVYTLRKRREHLSRNIYNEVFLSPEVKYITKKANKFNLEHPFSEIKFQSPSRINHKKSLSFTSFSAESSFLSHAKKSHLQSHDSSIKDSTGVASMSGLTPAPTSAFKSFIRSEQNINPRVKNMSLSEKNRIEEFSIINENQGDNFTDIHNDSLQILSNSILETAKSFATDTASMALAERLTEVRTLSKDVSILVQPSERNLHLSANTSFPIAETVVKSIHFSNSFSVPDKTVFCDEQKVSASANEKFEASNSTSGIAHEITGRKRKIIESLPVVDTSLRFKEVCVNSNNSVTISKETAPEAIHLNSVVNNDATPMDESTTFSHMPIMETANESLHDLHEENKLHKPHKITIHEALKPSENLSTTNQCAFQKTNVSISFGRTVILPEMTEQHEDLSNVEILDPHKMNVSISPKKSIGDETSRQSKEPPQFDIPDSNKIDYLFDQEKIGKRDETSEISEDLSLIEIPGLNCTHNLINPSETVGINEVSKQPEILDKHVIEDVVNLTFSRNAVPVENEESSISAGISSTHFLEKSPCKAASSYLEPFEKMDIPEMNLMPLTAKGPEEDISIKPTEYEFSEVHNDSSVTDSRMLSAEEDWDSLRIRFEKASEGSCWKLETLDKVQAVFRLEWGVWLYRCIVMIYIDPWGPGESNISFEPYPEEDEEDDEFTPLGYKFFNHLVSDEVVPFSVCDAEMIEKLTSYSCVAKKVETLMRDIMHISVGEIYTLTEDLNPLVLSVEVLNENHVSTFLLTFHVNLETYPSERMIPEVKHLKCRDITKEVEDAVRDVEPKGNYLWNMVKVASHF